MRKFDKQKFEKKHHFLERYVFHGLTNINDGFDAPTIFYFSSSDFSIALKRIERLKIGIYGIEPWDMNNHYYNVKLFNDYSTDPSDPKWYKKAYEEFKDTGENLKYAASYYVPEEFIKKKKL